MTTPLHQSIAHWERLAACRTLEEIKAEELGCAACALCLTHIDACEGCPVAEHTGRVACYGSPYWPAARYEDDAREGGPFDPDEWQKLARAELDFLKGLEE